MGSIGFTETFKHVSMDRPSGPGDSLDVTRVPGYPPMVSFAITRTMSLPEAHRYIATLEYRLSQHKGKWGDGALWMSNAFVCPNTKVRKLIDMLHEAINAASQEARKNRKKKAKRWK